LRAKLSENSNRYGFSLFTCPIEAGERRDLQNVKRFKHSLAIVIADRPFDDGTERLIEKYQQSYMQISIALAYRDMAEMLSKREPIELAKVRYEDRVNFLRPDRFDDDRVWVSDQKIAENSVCDSVRIKYAAVREPGAVELSARERSFFEGASRAFGAYHLFHRSASDGYFLLRRDTGFLITATKTYKERLDLRRISWVTGYDRASNSIRYVGEFLPSSDAVEAAVVLQKCSDVGAVIHTHASDRWTRNPAYRDVCLVPELPYGEPALGDVLCEHVARGRRGFVIMQEHGEVFWCYGAQADTQLLEFLVYCCERDHPPPSRRAVAMNLGFAAP
jgi:hypothetical protein